MELTAFGIALALLCLATLANPNWQLRLILLTGAFGAATPLIVAGLGLPPGVPPACLFLAHVALQYLLGVHYPAERQAWRMLEPYLLAAAYALVTALIVPRLFAGAFTVWPQKPIPPYDIPVPLAPGLGNVTQSLYLLIEAALLTGTALYLTRSGANFLRLIQAYLATGYVVVAICGWQLASKITGLWYPTAFLYSNPGWVLYPGQTMGFVPRINGPFSEPAALAFYLAGTVFCCAWLLLRGHRSRMATILLPLSITALLLSTSTTGFVVLAMGGGILALYGFAAAPPRMRLRIFMVALPAAALFVAAGYSISVLSTHIEESIALVARQTLNKAASDSFINRTSVDYDSLALIFPSYGLGAGWGSVRASSLIPGLVANLGIIGVGLVLWFTVRLAGEVKRARRSATTVSQLFAIDALAAAVTGHVCAALVSGSALHALDFYVLLGALIACAARVAFEAAQHRRHIARAASPAMAAA
jgi:hypothetical protein